MLNVTAVLTSIVCDRAADCFGMLYGGHSLASLDLVRQAAKTALSAIGRSDALYHNIEHTSHVTLVGLEILESKQRSEGSLPATTWANTVVALLCHDIGYARGLCRDDTPRTLVTGVVGQGLNIVEGASDAVLMPVHVDRGKQFIEETYLDHDLTDIEFINACIERTRFPIPEDPWYAQTDDLPGLVRAADLIGQLSDPRYLAKLAAIFYEFEETGYNQQVGYTCPGDLLTGYPAFFENCVAPYIGTAKYYLVQSAEGRDILEHLHDNLAAARQAVPAVLPNVANS